MLKFAIRSSFVPSNQILLTNSTTSIPSCLITDNKMIRDINLYSALSAGQILNWRLSTYNKDTIGESIKYTHQEMLNLMDIRLSEENPIELLTKSITDKQVSKLTKKLINLSLEDDNMEIIDEDDNENINMIPSSTSKCINEQTDFNSLYQEALYQDALVANLSMNPFNVSDLCFFKFDSSFISYYNLKKHTQSILDYLRNSEILTKSSIVVFVADYVSSVESLYKINHKDSTKYTLNTKINSLSYLQILESDQNIQELGFDHVFHFSMEKLNDIFIELEKNALLQQKQIMQTKYTDLLQQGKKITSRTVQKLHWKTYSTMRNEVNDDAQLYMLKDLQQTFPGSQQIMFTRDKALQKKCEQENIFVIN
jgi:hypothetical protein